MNKKTGFFTLSSAAALAAGIAISFLYMGLTRNLFSSPLTSLKTAALVIIAVIFSAVISLRFIAPLFFKTKNDPEKESEAPSLFGKYSDFGAWLFFALCLSALIASPLADTEKYIGYAFISAVLSALCAVLSVIPCAEKLASCAQSASSLNAAAISALVLSIIPGFGIGSGIFCTAFSTIMRRDEKDPKNQCLLNIAAGIGGALISAALSICLAYFLLLK